MPDEASAAPEVTQDTPTTDTSSVETPQQESQDTTDYEARYKSLQAEFTRATQERAEYARVVDALRSDDPEIRRQAAEYLGYEIEDDEDDDEWADPSEQRLNQLEKQQQKLAEHTQQQEQAQQMQAYYAYVDEKVGELEKDFGFDLSDDDVRIVVNQAEQLGLQQDLDEPDWDGAKKWFQQYQDAAVARYKQTKKSQFVSPLGQAGSQKPNLDNDETRLDYFASLLATADD